MSCAGAGPGAVLGMSLGRGLVEKASWSGKVNGDVEAWRRCLPRHTGKGVDAMQAEAAAAEVSCTS